MGYEPVIAEQGSIPYGKEKTLDQYCYDEMENCDIVVVVIGGRAGSDSVVPGKTIVESEVAAALKRGALIYYFVDNDVLAEYKTWIKNRESSPFKPAHVDNPKVFEVVDSVFSLGRGNPLFPFRYSSEIVELLRDQLAGTFQSLLRQRMESRQLGFVDEANSLVTSLKSIVDSLESKLDQTELGAKAFREVSHPINSALKQVLRKKYPILVRTRQEMQEYLSASSYYENSDNYDPFELATHFASKNDPQMEVIVSDEIFDEHGNVRPCQQSDWNKDWIRRNHSPLEK